MRRFRHSLTLPGAGVRDGMLLAGAVLLSVVWYARHLGFYSDDWAFLGNFVTAPDQTIGGLVDASIGRHHAPRPVQVWLCAALYRLFGLQPLGYHLVNALLLVASPVLLYALLRELSAPRTIALAVPLLYALLPTYSTERYWVVAFMITLSSAACFASIHADVKAAVAPVGRGLVWKAIAAAALLVSTLAYEVAMPLFLVAPFVMVHRARRAFGALSRERVIYLCLLIAINVVLLAGVAAFKVRTTIRLGAQQGIAAQVTDIARKAVRPDVPYGAFGLNLFSALRLHFDEYGFELPARAVALVPSSPRAVLWLTGGFALLVFAYLVHAFRRSPWPSLVQWSILAAAGLVVFFLGYAIFLTNYNVQITPTGVANRTAIVAALGAAMGILGVAGGVLTWLPRPGAARILFAAFVAAMAASGFLIVNVTGAFWIAAHEEQQDVLADIRARFPSLQPGSTLILDGICPYAGPATVFESDWDLAGALKVMYKQRRLSADIVTPRLTVEEEGIRTSLYGRPNIYPYSSRLFVYDRTTGVTHPLPNRAAAREYFAASDRGRSCPPGSEGVGVRIF